jgi:hypothetical protein
VYSPKINEELIAVLYHTARAQGIPMTVLVNRLLTESLAREDLPPMARDAFASYAVPAEDLCGAHADNQLVA